MNESKIDQDELPIMGYRGRRLVKLMRCAGKGRSGVRCSVLRIVVCWNELES